MFHLEIFLPIGQKDGLPFSYKPQKLDDPIRANLNISFRADDNAGNALTDEGFGFDSFMLPREELEAAGYGQEQYLLATDTAVVVPISK